MKTTTCEKCGYPNINTKWVKERLATYCPLCGADLTRNLAPICLLMRVTKQREGLRDDRYETSRG